MANMNHTPRIVVLGSLNTDLVTVTSRVPVGGETLTAKSFSTGPGGKGLNQAVGCARAAITAEKGNTIQVAMLGATGDENDLMAAALHDTLKEEGIDSTGVQRIPHVSSGTATILVEEESGENRILVVPGANGKVSKAFLEETGFKSLLWGDAGSPKAALLVLQLEIPPDTVIEIIDQAKSHEVPVLFNPSPAIKEIPQATLAKIDHLIVNETEAEILLANGHVMSGKKTGSDDWLKHIFDSFASIGVLQLIVTMGAKGAYYSTTSTSQGYEFVPAVKVPSEKVVDTTGAGDTFVGAYAVEVVRSRATGMDTRKAIERACKASSLAVQRSGAASSIPFGTDY